MTYQLALKGLQKRINESKELLGQINDQDYDKFHGLDFYHWDKPKDQQQGTFVDLVGLPKKNGIEHGFYDYEKDIIDYLERDEPGDPKNKHLYILKSAGLGITTALLYFIGWRCTRSNEWSGGRVNLLTSPRLDLTIDLMNRFKRLFTERNLIQFDTRNTICQLNNVTIEAFPSHLGLKSMRGLVDVKMILCDEASYFDLNQNQEVTETIDRYAIKSKPIICLVSTPQRPGDLMDVIRQQPENECFYKRMFLNYKVGLNKIYTPEEIAIQRKSLSFDKEMNLSFESGIDTLFSPADIAAITSEPYDSGDDTIKVGSLTYWLGCDPGFSTSSFGLVVIRFRDSKLEVVYEAEVKHADLDEMRHLLHTLISKYSVCRCFIDSSSISLIRQLCKDYSIPDVTMYDDKTKDGLLLTTGCGGPNLIQSVSFRTKHRLMLEQLHKIVSTHQIRIDPVKFPKVVTALRTATNKANAPSIWELDKTQSSSNDVLDALRLSLLCLRSSNGGYSNELSINRY